MHHKSRTEARRSKFVAPGFAKQHQGFLLSSSLSESLDQWLQTCLHVTKGALKQADASWEFLEDLQVIQMFRQVWEPLA